MFAKAIIAVWLIAFPPIDGKAQPHAVAVPSDLSNLETLLKDDGGAIAVTVINSRVEIETVGIDELAARGAAVVPSMARIMETPDISFDTFARCYSVCQRVLDKQHPGESLYWDGGAEMKKDDHRVYPGGRLDQKEFRAEVVKSVREKLLGGAGKTAAPADTKTEPAKP